VRGFVSTNRGRFVTFRDHYLDIWPSSPHSDLVLKLIFRQAPSESIYSDTIPHIHEPGGRLIYLLHLWCEEDQVHQRSKRLFLNLLFCLLLPTRIGLEIR
jgi:hypothetical protein